MRGGWANGPKLDPLDFPPVSRELWGVGGWGARVLCWAGLVMKLQMYNYKMVHAISKFRPVEATRKKIPEVIYVMQLLFATDETNTAQ